jgi:hypothetical protein
MLLTGQLTDQLIEMPGQLHTYYISLAENGLEWLPNQATQP